MRGWVEAIIAVRPRRAAWLRVCRPRPPRLEERCSLLESSRSCSFPASDRPMRHYLDVCRPRGHAACRSRSAVPGDRVRGCHDGIPRQGSTPPRRCHLCGDVPCRASRLLCFQKACTPPQACQRLAQEPSRVGGLASQSPRRRPSTKAPGRIPHGMDLDRATWTRLASDPSRPEPNRPHGLTRRTCATALSSSGTAIRLSIAGLTARRGTAASDLAQPSDAQRRATALPSGVPLSRQGEMASSWKASMAKERGHLFDAGAVVPAQLGGAVAQDVRRDALQSGLGSVAAQVGVVRGGGHREDALVRL